MENVADSRPFPKKAHSFGGVDECQCAVRPEYRRVGADHFPTAARIEVRHLGNIDHKMPNALLKLVQHMFAKANKSSVVNHSAGDLDEIDVVSYFRRNLHAPTVFPDSIDVKILCVDIETPSGNPYYPRIRFCSVLKKIARFPRVVACQNGSGLDQLSRGRPASGGEFEAFVEESIQTHRIRIDPKFEF